MKTKDQKPVKNLFDEKPFLDAISNKDTIKVQQIVRKSCNSYFEDIFNEPGWKELKMRSISGYINTKNEAIERYDKSIKWLSEVIIELDLLSIHDNEEELGKIKSEMMAGPEYALNLFHFIIGTPEKNRPILIVFEHRGLKDIEEVFFGEISKGNTDSVVNMIENGINIHVKSEELQTALMVAVEFGQHSIAEILLKMDADINARETVDAESDGRGATSLHLAAINKDCQMIDLLLKYGCNINERAGFEGKSPFLIGIYSKDYDFMDFALQKGADINIELYNGETGLIHAVLSNDKELANYLLEKGVDVDHRNITGLTALEVAKEKGTTEMEELLIQAGAEDDHRMLEHLVTYCQDLYVWDNDIAYAYYHWSTDDGFSHFLIYGIGYLNKMLALSELRRFYIRTKGDEIEAYAGDDHHWFHYVFSKNGEVVGEKFNKCSHGFWGNLICPDDSKEFVDTNAFEPENSKLLDFESKYEKLSDFFRKFVSFVEENDDSASNDENEKYIFTRYSKNGWNFLGPYWERRSVNVKDEHEKLISDLMLQYFVY